MRSGVLMSPKVPTQSTLDSLTKGVYKAAFTSALSVWGLSLGTGHTQTFTNIHP